MSKILAILLLLATSASKMVYRIVRPQDTVHVSFQNDRFKRLVDYEINNFSKIVGNLESDVRACMIKHIQKPEVARLSCLGANFSKFNDRFLLTKFKIRSIFEHLLDLLVTQNCVIYDNARTQCYKLLQDIKMLIDNEYDVLAIIDANKEKYINEYLKQEEYDDFFDLLVYLYEKYEIYEDGLDKQRDVLQGQLWLFYKEDILTGKITTKKETDPEVSQSELDAQALSARVNKQIEEKFSDVNSEYRTFIEVEGMENPFADDDELAQAKLEAKAEEQYQANKASVEGRFTMQVDAPAKARPFDCSASKDYELCIRDKIREVFSERKVKKQSNML